MTLADNILNEVNRESGLAETEIAVRIFGRRDPNRKRRVNTACRYLVEAGRLDRRGKGGPGDPFTYRIASKL